MNDMSNAAEIGHNGGPPIIDPEVLADHTETVRKFADAVKKWIANGKITDEGTAEKLTDFIAGARTSLKTINDARTKAKKPFLDCGKEVDATFKTLTEALTKAAILVKPLLEDYMEIKRVRLAEEAAEATRNAEEEARGGALLAAEAEAQDDVLKMAKAEETTKAAEKSAKAAEKAKAAPVNVKSATGGGRTMSERTQRSAKITNINVLFLHYRENPKVVALLEQLATADIRAKDVDESKIPGIEIVTKRSVA